MKRYTPWGSLLLMLSLAFILQGCLGIGGNTTPNGTTITTNSSGNQVSVVQNLFKPMAKMTHAKFWLVETSLILLSLQMANGLQSA